MDDEELEEFFHPAEYQIQGNVSFDLSNDFDSSFKRFYSESNQLDQVKQIFLSTGKDSEESQSEGEDQKESELLRTAKDEFYNPEKIEVNFTYLSKIKKTKEGRANETVNLLKILKGELLNHFKTLKMFKMLSPKEIQTVEAFKEEKPSFKSLHKFFENKQIKEKSIQYLCSSQITKNLLESKTLQFERKIQVLKYLEKFTKGTEELLTQWKDS